MLSTSELKQVTSIKEREIEVCGKCGEPLTYLTAQGVFACDNNHINYPELVTGKLVNGNPEWIPTFLTFRPQEML
jgi:hypothetical protein